MNPRRIWGVVMSAAAAAVVLGQLYFVANEVTHGATEARVRALYGRLTAAARRQRQIDAEARRGAGAVIWEALEALRQNEANGDG